ncbi:hypothetical protein IWQ47_003549 [Aquimarina sp. EL_43]|uniref:hypothetical protein n=1 Tax=unclassified Aquimarina TaxID=2627091 RepID=UPI0018CBDC29|nr:MULTISPECIES: hypothetical protein [unclassified Aquimarina]MBG6132479.1 hypothetical protein [Aquimarina sp. EL_35]MBG6152610.1 hypothetical protein [Aquimarina sp. EL_32]MBG6170463.1 hypothetical protein [Aquimarina sp. EL_43]
MKKILIKTIPWATIIALIVFLAETCNRVKTCCEICYEYSDQHIKHKDNNEDYMLKFNCSEKTNFQPIHLDLVHSFGLLGLMEIDNNSTLKKMHIRLKEIGKCEKYSIVQGSIKYLNHTVDSITKNKTHHITVKLRMNNSDRVKEDIVKLPKSIISIKNEDLIDIHLDAKDLNIPTFEEIINGIVIHKPLTHFGDQQCNSRIIGGAN